MRLFCWAGPLLIPPWWNTNGLMFIGIAVSSFKIQAGILQHEYGAMQKVRNYGALTYINDE